MSRFTESRYFLPFVVVFVATAVIFGLHLSKPKVEEEKNEFPPLSVDVVQASLDEATRSSYFQGEVRAKTNIDLITQVSGKVTNVSSKFVEGGLFAPNEPLLKIDDADYLVALRSAEAAVAEAKVQLEIELASAATSKKEWQNLQGKNLNEASPLRLNKPQVDRARARLKAAEAELSSAQLNVDRTTLSAPFAGRIMSKQAELGQFIARGSSIGRVFASDEMEVRIPMTDTQIAELGLVVGQALSSKDAPRATISTQFGDQTHSWPGHLRSIDASIDNETRLLYATVVADQASSEGADFSMPLAPGLFVDVELLGSQRIAGVKVPRTALRSGSRVYVIEDEQLKFREVKTIYTSADIAILDPHLEASLNAGELVIMSPVPGAYEGMAVKVNGAELIEQLTEFDDVEVSIDSEVEELPKTELAEPEAAEQPAEQI